MTKLFLTVKQFCDKNKEGWPSETSLRSIIFDSNRGKNNFKSAFKKYRKRILVDEEEFWKCFHKNQKK